MVDLVVVVFRHNVSLETDLDLAERETDALAQAVGVPLADRKALIGALGVHLPSGTPLLTDAGHVGRLYRELSIEAVARLTAKAAFAQEVFVSASPDVLHDVADAAGPWRVQTGSLIEGRALAVPALNYVVEAESVTNGNRDPDAPLASTARLLLEPYVHGAKRRPGGQRVRAAKKTTLSLTHDLHVYKAKFFPRMIRALINIFALDKGLVVDPYCGSGTALLEASLLGHPAHGIDADPISVMISRAKVAPFLSGDALPDLNVLDRAMSRSSPATENGKPVLPAELRRKLERQDRKNGTAYVEEVSRDVQAISGIATAGSWKSDVPHVLLSDAVTKKVRYRFVGVGNGRYTVEVLKQPITDRLQNKSQRCREIAATFQELQTATPFPLGTTSAILGDARDAESWGLSRPADLIVTSPPYLPASSGREHYAAARALSFQVLGVSSDETPNSILGESHPTGRDVDIISHFPESTALLDYLAADTDGDPQRDAMRGLRKLEPTKAYLMGMLDFFEAARQHLSSDGYLLLVVANQHTFYSHRRSVVEHMVDGERLYSELASAKGFEHVETIRMQLVKSSASRARPRAKDDYYEAVLVLRPSRVASAT